MQKAYSEAVYGHLRMLTEGHGNAAKIMANAGGDNGIECWRRLTRKFHPQNDAVQANKLQSTILFGIQSRAKNLGEVANVLNALDKLEEYEEAAGEKACNEPIKNKNHDEAPPDQPPHGHQ